MALESSKQEFKAATLCINNCGFYSSIMKNMCSKCYKDSKARRCTCRRRRQEASLSSSSRCLTCGKKVGLAGFRCYCAETFCSVHRYADAHRWSLSSSMALESSKQEFKAATLCINNCGFYSSIMKNMCSKCYKDSKARRCTCRRRRQEASLSSSSRCLTCGKKVGLAGFRCYCVETFCSVHRYADAHQCTFDYKTTAREHITKENPVVMADKMTIPDGRGSLDCIDMSLVLYIIYRSTLEAWMEAQ